MADSHQVTPSMLMPSFLSVGFLECIVDFFSSVFLQNQRYKGRDVIEIGQLFPPLPFLFLHDVDSHDTKDICEPPDVS